MPRRNRYSDQHGKHRKRRRGVHKNARSPETAVWENEHLIPDCPPWLERDVYTRLAELRRSL
jgi:hypothetical protein